MSVITFRGVTGGPFCLILVVFCVDVVCVRLSSTCQFSARSGAVWKRVLSSVGSIFSLSTICLIFFCYFRNISKKKTKLVFCFLQPFKGWKVAVAATSLESTFSLIPLGAGLNLQLCPQISELLLLVRCFLSQESRLCKKPR